MCETPESSELREIQQNRLFTLADLPTRLTQHIKMHKQLSPGWFNQRKKRITGSKLSQFLFMDGIADMQRLHGEIFSGRPKEPFDELSKRRCAFGQKHEIDAVCSYLRQFPNILHMDVTFRLHPTFPEWLGSTSDGLVVDTATKEIKLLEIKCPYGDFEGENAKAFKGFPEYYIPQIVMQQMCYSIPTTTFVVWTKKAFKVYEVNLDPTYAQGLLLFLKEFYQYDDICTNEGYCRDRVDALKTQTRTFRKKHVRILSPRGGFKTSLKFNEQLKAFHEVKSGHE